MLDDAEYAAHWWRLAVGDLAGARAIAGDRGLPPRLAASLAHQAAEKSFKAVIALNGEEPPRIHDLVALAARLTGDAATAAPIEALTRLSDAYGSLRYPDLLEPPLDWPVVDELIGLATIVMDDVRASLERRGMRLDTLPPA